MGLDMNLYGKKLPMAFGDKAPTDEEGFVIASTQVELAYWRKHPNLHGYIVETFADGVDECQNIELGVEELENIKQAIENDDLPHTEGFFFGKSFEPGEYDYIHQKDRDINFINRAITWVKNQKDEEFRVVVYRASW